MLMKTTMRKPNTKHLGTFAKFGGKSVVSKVFHPTWCLHYSLHVLLLELLNALAFGFGVLLQGADLMHILIVEEL